MTKRADYALLALCHLANAAANDSKRLVNTKEIADQYEIPLELLAKILQTLAKHSLISSHSGPTGGYRLLRDSKEISVSEVMTLIEGPLSFLPCSNGQELSCKQFSHCTIRNPLGEIEDRVRALLSEMSIYEISGAAHKTTRQFEDFSNRHFAAGLRVG